MVISTEPDPQGTGRVDILTHPYTTAACAAGVVTRTADRNSSRYRYSGIRRTRQLALGCEGNRIKSTHDAYENTWKCGEQKLFFFFLPHYRKIKKNKKKQRYQQYRITRKEEHPHITPPRHMSTPAGKFLVRFSTVTL